ncbi:DUF6427 family protein [Capnocytophaga canimorsus]|uniref:DUF6427 family protein n=2 Tax=Capnocytophaga canimorsus TaxID=28188 RepID=UPI000D6E021D|nr:DUF6427 family protein [Capnocytophaga canimorsus]AWL78792.1 hypothetical protein DKB58_07480 [Capnocytophaga canimorsus]MDT9500174.1 hypothetical protein [Capnocytophaga canimorsus]
MCITDFLPVMISGIFENTKPANILLVFILSVLGYLTYGIFIFEQPLTLFYTFNTLGELLLIFIGLIFIQSIILKNDLTQGSSYPIVFFGVFISLFPQTFQNLPLIASNTLIIISLWRIMTLRTGKKIAQKIFDASFLIACAALFYPWAILFLITVWFSLLFYGSKKGKYWFIPLVALFSVIVISLMISLLLGITEKLPNIYSWQINLNYETFLSLEKIVPLAFMTLLLLISIFFFFSKKSANISTNIKYIAEFLFIGLFIVFLSKEIIFIYIPLAILLGLYVEQIQRNWLKETILYTILLSPLVVLVLHFITKG